MDEFGSSITKRDIIFIVATSSSLPVPYYVVTLYQAVRKRISYFLNGPFITIPNLLPLDFFTSIERSPLLSGRGHL